MERRGLRRSTTLAERLMVVESSKLRELLNVRDEDDKRGGRTSLLDIMREEQVTESFEVAVDRNPSNGVRRKSFRDRLRLRLRLRLRRSISAWAAAVSAQTNLIAHPEIVLSVHRTAGGSIAAAAAAASQPEEYQSGAEATTGGQESANLGPATESLAPSEAAQPMRVSLMVLLQQTDRQWSSGRESASPAAAAALAALQEEETAADVVGSDGAGGTVQICCVCMVRYKGAAFIPCGHTFCRRCSRELWANRRSCPLCNNYILEVLDIF